MELGLMLSHTCNITCRHCGILSSPQNKNRMRLEDARRWIIDASHIPIIKHVNFTGGEPFLFQDEHAELLALCRSLGFREVGVYRRHGKLDGAWRDVVIVELLFGEPARES